MNPYRFGPPGRELFGVYFPPAGATPRRTAVVACAPFGPEATRAHRLYRVLCERIAKAGYAVLRFDWYGTGDSDGEFAEASLARWREDLAIAQTEALVRSGARAAALVGLRLGGTLAIEAAGMLTPRPLRVVAWDPIVEGAAYLDELAAAHVAFLKRDFGLGWLAVRARVERAQPIRDETLGFPLVDTLRAELGALDLAKRAAPPVETVLISTQKSPAIARLEQAMPELSWRHVRSGTAWNSDEAMNASIVPLDLVEQVAKAIEDLP